MQFTRLALCAVVCAASAIAGDLTITPGFKLAAGAMTGGVKDITQSSGNFGLAVTGELKLGEKSAITGEFGFHWFPGKQYLAESYPRTANFPLGYTPGATYRDRISKADAQGWELAVAYRYSLTSDLYVRAGIKAGYYKATEQNIGTELVANTIGQITVARTIVGSTEKKTLSPGAVVGVGYFMAPNHAVELNVGNVRMATETLDAKNGIAWEVAYCMRF